MKHYRAGPISVGWVNLTRESRAELLELDKKIQGAINASESSDPETADGLFEFNLALIGMEIVSGGLGYSPPLGAIRAPHPLAEGSWEMPAYIIPMNL